jgi:hypothetical protein
MAVISHPGLAAGRDGGHALVEVVQLGQLVEFPAEEVLVVVPDSVVDISHHVLADTFEVLNVEGWWWWLASDWAKNVQTLWERTFGNHIGCQRSRRCHICCHGGQALGNVLLCCLAGPVHHL